MFKKNQLRQRLDTLIRFVQFVTIHFIRDDCTYIASALTFTTLLAIVPLVSVGVSVLSTFPVFQGLVDPIQNFIFENFVPSTGKVVQSYVHQFTAQVAKLSVWGVAFLTITALLMMLTIERTMNKIWRVDTSRRGISAFLLYWAILSLSPVMLGLSLAVSSYLYSMSLMINYQASFILWYWSPFLFALAGFSFLYSVVPNCPVRFRHAFCGALFATICFEVAKHAFVTYLTHYNTYELLYGAFAAVPMFFIWIYWVWIITLLGTEICYALSVDHQRRAGKSLDGFSHALLWLNRLWQAQQQGGTVTFNELVESSHQPFATDANIMLAELKKHGLVGVTLDGNYFLSQDLSQISLYSLNQLLPYRLPTDSELSTKSSLAEQWREIIKHNNQGMSKSLSVDLDTLFKK